MFSGPASRIVGSFKSPHPSAAPTGRRLPSRRSGEEARLPRQARVGETPTGRNTVPTCVCRRVSSKLSPRRRSGTASPPSRPKRRRHVPPSAPPRTALYEPHPPPRPRGAHGLAPVAQLDRVLPSEGRGHWFESSRVRQSSSDDLRLSARLQRAACHSLSLSALSPRRSAWVDRVGDSPADHDRDSLGTMSMNGEIGGIGAGSAGGWRAEGMGRRSFLIGSAAAVGTLALGGCVSSEARLRREAARSTTGRFRTTSSDPGHGHQQGQAEILPAGGRLQDRRGAGNDHRRSRELLRLPGRRRRQGDALRRQRRAPGFLWSGNAYVGASPSGRPGRRRRR